MHITVCRLEVLKKISGEKSLPWWYVVFSLCFIGHTQLSLFLFSHHCVQNLQYNVFLLSLKVEWRKGKRWKVSFSNITTIWARNITLSPSYIFFSCIIHWLLFYWDGSVHDQILCTLFVCQSDKKAAWRSIKDHEIIIHFCTACFMCLQSK